jgi:4-aminobutyrate aminotransferase-like enzyme
VTADQALAAATALFTTGHLPALVLIEAVQAVSGLISAGPAFLRGLSELCRQHDIPLALDEVWNGIGRTGQWFGFDQAGITPDLVIMGKALSGGLPLSAVAAGERFLGQWPAGMHTSTFQGNPLACAMALATLDTIRNHDLLSYVRTVIAPLLTSALMPLRDGPGIADVRVAGAQAAISFCTTDGQPDPARAQALQRAMLDRQILVYGGGASGECLMLVPPLNLAAEPLSRALADLVTLIDAKEHDIPLG